VLSRSYYSALLLPAEAAVNVSASIINSANFKSPTHGIFPHRSLIRS
jgi:hypothetical protein